MNKAQIGNHIMVKFNIPGFSPSNILPTRSNSTAKTDSLLSNYIQNGTTHQGGNHNPKIATTKQHIKAPYAQSRSVDISSSDSKPHQPRVKTSRYYPMAAQERPQTDSRRHSKPAHQQPKQGSRATEQKPSSRFAEQKHSSRATEQKPSSRFAEQKQGSAHSKTKSKTPSHVKKSESPGVTSSRNEIGSQLNTLYQDLTNQAKAFENAGYDEKFDLLPSFEKTIDAFESTYSKAISQGIGSPEASTKINSSKQSIANFAQSNFDRIMDEDKIMNSKESNQFFILQDLVAKYK